MGMGFLNVGKGFPLLMENGWAVLVIYLIDDKDD